MDRIPTTQTHTQIRHTVHKEEPVLVKRRIEEHTNGYIRQLEL